MTQVSNEINWMISKAIVSKVFKGECVVKEFNGMLPYRMVMNAIKNNDWDNKSEGGAGSSAYWNVSKSEGSKEYGFHYNCKTGRVAFYLREAI